MGAHTYRNASLVEHARDMAAALLPGSRSWLTSRAYKLQAMLFHPGLSPQFDRATNAIYLRQCHRLAAGRGSACDTPSWVTSSHPRFLHFSSSLGVKGVKVAPNVAPNADLPGV